MDAANKMDQEVIDGLFASGLMGIEVPEASFCRKQPLLAPATSGSNVCASSRDNAGSTTTVRGVSRFEHPAFGSHPRDWLTASARLAHIRAIGSHPRDWLTASARLAHSLRAIGSHPRYWLTASARSTTRPQHPRNSRAQPRASPWHLPTTQEYGGVGASFTAACLCIEELARVDPAVSVRSTAHDQAHLLHFSNTRVSSKYAKPSATKARHLVCDWRRV